MGLDPKFIASPITDHVSISTANTNRNGTGTLGTAHTAGANGSLITNIRIVAEGTTTAGVIRIFLDDTADVALWHEILVEAITPSTTVQVWSYDLILTVPLKLEATHIIKASTHNAETFNVFVHGGSY